MGVRGRLVLAQRAVRAKASEVGALPDVLALKDNQPRLCAEVQILFTDAAAVAFQGVEHRGAPARRWGHGRVEVRQTWAITDPAHLGYLDPEGTWPNVHSIVMLRAERRTGDRTTQDDPGDALPSPQFGRRGRAHRMLARAVRALGHREGLHGTLDVAFREDESRVRRATPPTTSTAPKRAARAFETRGADARRRSFGSN